MLLEIQHGPPSGRWGLASELPEFMDQRINEYLLWTNPSLGAPRSAEEFRPLPADLSPGARAVLERGAWWVRTWLSVEEFEAGVSHMRESYPDHSTAAGVEFDGALAFAREVRTAGAAVRFVVLLDH